MKKYIFLIMLIMMAGTSCQKFINQAPTDFQSTASYYNTEAQLQSALAGVYAAMASSDAFVYGSGLWFQFNINTDLDYYGGGRVPSGDFAYQYAYNDGTISGMWTDLYAGIERANLILANINKATVSTQVNRNQIQGEALFLRSYYYFLLITYFGDVPLKLQPTSSIINVAVPRTPIKDIYTQIIADMTTADGLVQPYNVIQESGRVTQSAVEGILARVCLYSAGYPNLDKTKYADALKWASKVVNNGIHQLEPDFKQVFYNYIQDKYDETTYGESIFECEFWGNRTGNAYFLTSKLGSNIGIGCSDLTVGYSFSYFYCTPILWNLFVDNGLAYSRDLRREWTITPYTLTVGPNGVQNVHNPYPVIAPTAAVPNPPVWGRQCSKWRREYEVLLPKSKNDGPENFPILRYADVLLMQAEAENYVNGPDATAYTAINKVRERAFGSGYKVTSYTVTNGGSGYTAAPTVTVAPSAANGGANNPALANAVISAGKVTSITVISSGAFYSNVPPVVTLTGVGTGATVTANLTAINPPDNDLTPGLSQGQFQQAIQDERARELSEEALRRSDLVRWGIMTQTINNLINMYNTITPNGATLTNLNTIYLNYAPTKQLFPIPAVELTNNSAATQNPGY